MSSRIRKNDKGLDFITCDLHIHTPASKDYQDKEIDPDTIIVKAIEKDLDAICITDHNTAEWIDRINRAAEGRRITVFPGVEISSGGGKDGPIHIIALFEKGTTEEEINDLLSRIGLTKTKRGNLEELADCDPNKVIEEITKQNGLSILAHVDSSHGVLHDMKGQGRIKLIRNKNVCAAEVTKQESIEYLNGNDPNYQRKLATYQSSDSHSIETIGKKRTYFRVANRSIEALRQCFLDPDVRIFTQEKYDGKSEAYFPKILSIDIDQGFFSGTSIRFHKNQNCLIGGQGVGKSLIIECIRFVLDQQSRIDVISTDSESKLKMQLGEGGKVKIRIELENGSKYTVERKYSESNAEAVVVNEETSEVYSGDLFSLFPIIAYSQTEAVEIARNTNSQLELIDSFIDVKTIQDRIDRIKKDLAKNDTKIAQTSKAHEEIIDVNRSVKTISESIKNVEKALKNPVLTEMKKAEDIKGIIDEYIAYPDELIETLEAVGQDLIDSHSPIEVADELKDELIVKQISKETRKAFNQIRNAVKNEIKGIKEQKELLDGLYKSWLPEYKKIEKRYEKFIQDQGGDVKNLEAKRRKLSKEKQGLEEQQKSLHQQASKISEVKEERQTLLYKLQKEQESLYLLRKDEYELLSRLSQGKLNISINKASNKDDYEKALIELCTGSRIRKNEISKIANDILPIDFVNYVLEKNTKDISNLTEIEETTIQKIIDWLTGIDDRKLVLELQYKYLLHDEPMIEYQKEDNKYYKINELSVGQKCTALLIIALIAGNNPVIIDQPEESIDIASVFNDVVTKLRINKLGRQYILTTHNANIAVTADSDLIHVLKATATYGKIEKTGAIEDNIIKDEVIEHLEGGKEPYLLRGEKYGLL